MPRSVFDHQITLKGMAFIGGLPEHIIKKAHLDASDVMGAAAPKGAGAFGEGRGRARSLRRAAAVVCAARSQRAPQGPLTLHCVPPAGARRTLCVVESGASLGELLDAQKTVNAFPVIALPRAPGEAGDFVGIISRARRARVSLPRARAPALLQHAPA